MTKKNIDLVRLLFDQQASKNDLSLYEDLFAENILIHGPASGQTTKGITALKKLDGAYNLLYPEKKFKLQEIFANGNKVIVQWICHGKHKGEIKGLNTKKKDFSISGLSIYRLSKGKIVEVWQFWDRLGILEQIGEVHVRPVEPGYYYEILKGLGMETYAKKASLLSKRERECLTLLLQGKTAKETAALLKLSPRTIESYFETLKVKLQCSNKGELFTIAQTLEKLELL